MANLFCRQNLDAAPRKVLSAFSPISSAKARHLERAVRRYETSDFLLCLSVLLPEWEWLNRLIFCRVNGCAGRMLTAETDTLYTTFDEMTSESLPDGTENRFPKVIGIYQRFQIFCCTT
jgi:hypothetical protein